MVGNIFSFLSSRDDNTAGGEQRHHQKGRRPPPPPPPSSEKMTINKKKKKQQQQQQQDDAPPASAVATTKKLTASSSHLPLSMRLLSRLPSSYCSHCSSGGGGSSFGGGGGAASVVPRNYNDEDDEYVSGGGSCDIADDLHRLQDVMLAEYDIPALRRQNSSVSPLVVAPMMSPIPSTSSSSKRRQEPSTGGGSGVVVPAAMNVPSAGAVLERIISEYLSACDLYGCRNRVNPGVLTALRFSLPALRVSGSFHDADMLALCEILLRYVNGPLRYIRRLDFSVAGKEGGKSNNGKRGFRSHGAFALSKVLQISDSIEEVYLQRNRIGPYGASAVFIACSNNPSIKKLVLRRCRVCERGALAFAELVAPSSECGLVEVDLSANYIGFKGSIAIEQALKERKASKDLHEMTVDLEGNLVFQEGKILFGMTNCIIIYSVSKKVSYCKL